jgi:hypothetical protein
MATRRSLSLDCIDDERAVQFILKSALVLVAIVLAGTRMLPGQHSVANAPRRQEQSQFSVELVPIRRLVRLSEAALSVLSKDERVASCLENAGLRPEQLPADWFMASEIHLNGPGERDLIVSPGGPQDGPPQNDCLVGANTAQFWVLRKTPEGYTLVLSQIAHNLDVLQTRTNGFRDIRLSAVVSLQVVTIHYRFSGHSYELAGQNRRSCLQYEPTEVTLAGTLIRKTFPGPPEFQSVRKGDRPETYWLLVLASPVCVGEDKSDPASPAQEDIRRIQLVVNEEIYKKYKGLVGKRIVVTGTLFGAITAHHYTPVVLTVSTLGKALAADSRR